MSCVMAAKNLRIKLRPLGQSRVDLQFLLVVWGQGKSMAGRANSHERFAGLQMRSHSLQLLCQRSAAPYADKEQIRIVQRLDQAGEIVLVGWIGLNNRRPKGFRVKFGFG